MLRPVNNKGKISKKMEIGHKKTDSEKVNKRTVYIMTESTNVSQAH